MSELVEFIRGCLDADEQTARAAITVVGDDMTTYSIAEWWEKPEHARVYAGHWHPVVQAGQTHGDPVFYNGAALPHIARHDPARVLAEVNAKRAILDWHENWPVLVETPPTVEPVDSADPQSFAFRASQRIAWMTEREYVARFGSEPPTSPILLMLAQPYAGEPGWRDEWGTQ